MRYEQEQEGKSRVGPRGSATQLLHYFTFGCAAPELVGQPLTGGSEREAHRIDAIALSGRRRPIGEDMSLMRAAARADDLGPDHAVAGVADVFEVTFGERLREARPARAALELGAAMEQRKAAEAAGEDARPLFLKENAAKRRLGAMLEEDVSSLRR